MHKSSASYFRSCISMSSSFQTFSGLEAPAIPPKNKERKFSVGLKRQVPEVPEVPCYLQQGKDDDRKAFTVPVSCVKNTRFWSINNPTKSMNPSSELQKVAIFPSEFPPGWTLAKRNSASCAGKTKLNGKYLGEVGFGYIYPPPRKSNTSIAHSIHGILMYTVYLPTFGWFLVNVGKNVPWMLRDI